MHLPTQTYKYPSYIIPYHLCLKTCRNLYWLEKTYF